MINDPFCCFGSFQYPICFFIARRPISQRLFGGPNLKMYSAPLIKSHQIKKRRSCQSFAMQFRGGCELTHQRHYFPDASQVSVNLNPDKAAKLFNAIKSFGFEKHKGVQQISKQDTLDRATERLRLFIRGKIHNLNYYLGCYSFDGEGEFCKLEN